MRECILSRRLYSVQNDLARLSINQQTPTKKWSPKTVILKSYHIYYMGPAKNCESVILTCQNSFEKNSRCVKLLWQYVPRESAAFMMHRRHFKLLFCIGRVLYSMYFNISYCEVYFNFNLRNCNIFPQNSNTSPHSHCRKDPGRIVLNVLKNVKL